MDDITKGLNNEPAEEMGAAAIEETAGQAEGQEKKYTDADIDRIIKKRLAREREKLSRQEQKEQQESELEQRERDLARRELKADARDVLTQEGLPMSIAALLNYNSQEEYEASMKAARIVVGDLQKALDTRRATGRTPKSFAGNEGRDPVRDAFSL